jgi:RNA polymerase sigma-70 factor (ECF subfamily)
MEELSDLELVQRVRGGDRQAFTSIMRRYQKRVYWTARRIVGDHHVADEVAQETFIKAYLALGSFRNDSSFFTWLYRIAVNLSLNAVRKRQVISYMRDSDILRRFLPSRERADMTAITNDLEARLHKAVSALPEKQRSVFVLRFFDDLSYEEIAPILETSVGGLKANYFHALRKVREFMSDENPEHN